MTLPRIYLIAIILLAFGVGASGQEPPKAVLVDEFGPDVVCENLAGRIDDWLKEVAEVPENVGYAIVRGREGQLLERMNRRDSIYGQVQWRFAHEVEWTRPIVVLEGAVAPSLQIQLFRSKKDDKSLLSKSVKWNLTLPIAKPFALYQSAEDGAPCPAVDHTKQFIDLLLANPSLRGNVVFHENNRQEFDTQKLRFLNGIPVTLKARLRFFWSRQYDESYEFWLLPARIK